MSIICGKILIPKEDFVKNSLDSIFKEHKIHIHMNNIKEIRISKECPKVIIIIE